jgi:hypothetical protein
MSCRSVAQLQDQEPYLGGLPYLVMIYLCRFTATCMLPQQAVSQDDFV